MSKIYFRHTFICPECENYNYRVTANPDPCVNLVCIDCGSCGERIAMNTHHATDVCLSPDIDTELLATAIIFGIRSTLCKNEDLESFAESCPVYVRILQKVISDNKKRNL